MIYPECQIAADDYPTDRIGHPMSGMSWGGTEQPLVFLRFIAAHRGDTEVLRIHREWVEVRHPIMLCGNAACINHKHMRFGRRDLAGELFEHEYRTESITDLQEDFAKKSEHRLERAQAHRDMAKIEDIRKTMGEMSDEELLEIIKGKRSLRREAAENATAKKKAAPKKKKDRAGDVAKVASSMTREQRLALLKELGLA